MEKPETHLDAINNPIVICLEHFYVFVHESLILDLLFGWQWELRSVSDLPWDLLE